MICPRHLTLPARIRAGGRTRARRDAGSGTVEMVITIPVFMFLMMLVVQVGMWLHASHIAQAAATRALATASAYQGSAAGRTAGHDTLDSLGGTVLKDPSVRVTRTATDVRVEVTGRVVTVVPGISWPVRATAAGAVERFVPATEDGTG
ncbi:MAG TPA: TadE family protein [Pilimelia sp.]|nr:TadE family protein [Pilimelia sp.]